jgi:hypothetical protein
MSRASGTFRVTVDVDPFVLAMEGAQRVLSQVISMAAEELEGHLRTEGGKASSRLRAKWPITITTGGKVAHVTAPEWWAHFVAGGTKAHGPRGMDFLHFFSGGKEVFAQFVRGTRATHFDAAAIALTESTVPDLISLAIAKAA